MNRGVLADWHERSSIRTASKRQLTRDDFEQGAAICFPEELAPWIQHPAVSSLGPGVKRAALAQQLFSYLNFTDRLEHEVVNQTVRRIATGASGFRYPAQTRLDAYKIYCDEAYHSLFSADIAMQIQEFSGFVFCRGAGHPGLDFFHKTSAALPPESRSWFELLFVTVSETLVSGSLERIPKSPQVLRAVREMAADHLNDEIRHHGFFAHFFRLAWPQIPVAFQTELGRLLPQCILSFLGPDAPAIRAFLSMHLSNGKTGDVLEDTYTTDALLAAARSASAATRRILKETGVFELSAIHDAFLEAGLEGFKVAGGN